MTARRLIYILMLLTLCVPSFAQHAADSIATVSSVKVDSTLMGKSIFNEMPSRYRGNSATVSITQSDAVRDAVLQRAVSGGFTQIDGYRIRIYFSNAQNAREQSEAEMRRFSESYSHNAYRSFIRPNFKVTVGDFRTRSEALRLLNSLRADFPAAFIVREKINIVY